MRVLLKLELDCTPDAAWDAIRSPQTLRDVSFPLTTFASLEDGGFPEQWPEGPHLVSVRAFGLTDIGRQCIEISYTQRNNGVRVARDFGRGVSGPLSLVTRWRHEMAVSALPDGRTLYRDQLRFSAGVLTLPMWLMYWVFWQWRAYGIRRLAPTWR
jgi:hypothetical protein